MRLIKEVTRRNRIRNNDLRVEFGIEPMNNDIEKNQTSVIWTSDETEREQIPE